MKANMMDAVRHLEEKYLDALLEKNNLEMSDRFLQQLHSVTEFMLKKQEVSTSKPARVSKATKES